MNNVLCRSKTWAAHHLVITLAIQYHTVHIPMKRSCVVGSNRQRCYQHPTTLILQIVSLEPGDTGITWLDNIHRTSWLASNLNKQRELEKEQWMAHNQSATRKNRELMCRLSMNVRTDSEKMMAVERVGQWMSKGWRRRSREPYYSKQNRRCLLWGKGKKYHIHHKDMTARNSIVLAGRHNGVTWSDDRKYLFM